MSTCWWSLLSGRPSVLAIPQHVSGCPRRGWWEELVAPYHRITGFRGGGSLKNYVAIVFPELYKSRARSTHTRLVDPELQKMEETNGREFFVSKTEWFPVKEDMVILICDYLRGHNWCSGTQTTTDLLSHYSINFWRKPWKETFLGEKNVQKV